MPYLVVREVLNLARFAFCRRIKEVIRVIQLVVGYTHCDNDAGVAASLAAIWRKVNKCQWFWSISLGVMAD
jgi:hypothetical protein